MPATAAQEPRASLSGHRHLPGPHLSPPAGTVPSPTPHPPAGGGGGQSRAKVSTARPQACRAPHLLRTPTSPHVSLRASPVPKGSGPGPRRGEVRLLHANPGSVFSNRSPGPRAPLPAVPATARSECGRTAPDPAPRTPLHAAGASAWPSARTPRRRRSPLRARLTLGGTAGHEEAGGPAREPLGRHGLCSSRGGLRVRGTSGARRRGNAGLGAWWAGRGAARRACTVLPQPRPCLRGGVAFSAGTRRLERPRATPAAARPHRL